MKHLIVLALACLAGCASVPSLDQLEAQAMLTGDWSAVERREKIIARRTAERGLSCPGRQVSLCVRDIGKTVCSCADRDALSGFAARR